MEILLYRSYHQNGVNGALYIGGKEVVKTIELPWRNNAARISCIPEGSYGLRKRYSLKFKHHFEVMGVHGRSLILLHPANDAERELKGCIAPVLQHRGEGKGSSSRIALERLKSHLNPILDRGEQIIVTIKNSKK